jgi:hypothetical protein
MGKGTENRLGALLQGLLATFTGGSLILFAVLAATIGLSTPQGESPSIAGGGPQSGGSVRVQGLEGDNQNAPGSEAAATGPATAQGPAAPGASTGAPTLVADSSVTAPSDSSDAVETTGEFGFSVPDVLTPDDDGTAGDPIGPPIGSPGAFTPTTDDELPDSFKKRFRAGNGLGARDVDKADRVERGAAGKTVKAKSKKTAKPKKEAAKPNKKDRGGARSAAGTGKKADKGGRADRSGSSDAKVAKKAGRDERRESKQADKQAQKESKQADKQAKKESKEAKKEEKGRSASGDDDHSEDDDDD